MKIEEPVNVLLVDDQPGKLLSYEVMLEELGENLISASSAKEALAFLLKADVAVILVDVCMPELDGFELASMIREHPRFQKTAIIFISAVHMSEADYLRGYQAGAVEYLAVPVVPELLRAKVKVFAELFRKTRQLRQLNEELEQRVAERTDALNASNAEFHKSEQGRSLALAAGNMGSWDWDVVNDHWFWDEGQSRMFGVEHVYFAPTMEALRNFIHPDDHGEFDRAIMNLSRDASSVEIEARILRQNGDRRWCRLVVVATFDKERVVRLSGVTTDITERKEAENKLVFLAREVDHRAKNTLAVVQAIIRLAGRDNIDEFIEGVEGRINALAQTHELLSRSRWQGADLLRLVLEELAPYQNAEPQRVTAVGSSVVVSPENAQTMAIALHELATNAAKYGALSCDGGRVDVSWSCLDGKVTLIWKESGGPPVHKPRAGGFGTKILTACFCESKKANADFDWNVEGLRCTLQFTTEAPGESSRVMPSPIGAITPVRGSGLRLLLVEDEVLVGLFMREMLDELGYQTSEPCRTLHDALAAANGDKFDGAVLDMNLSGDTVYPLAELLMTQGVPFIFVTGYCPDMVEDRFSNIPIIQKPISAGVLATTLTKHLASKALSMRREELDSPALRRIGDGAQAHGRGAV